MTRRFSVHAESWPAVTPFRISNNTWNEFAGIVVEVEQGGRIGRGEAEGVYYLEETVDSMIAQVESVQAEIMDGATRDDLQTLLPPGGARFAIDSALWDLEAQLSGRSAWAHAGATTAPVETVFTIGLEPEPEQMGAKAAAAADLTLFKVKLGSDRPVARIAAIRAVRPDARIVIDANQAWDFAQLQEVAPRLAELGVSMIEQPLPRGGDQLLEGFESPLPLCADESCLHLGELEQSAGRYQMINIKLDKTGGLTHALELAAAARARGLGLMVGCMGGTSLAMAPSHVLAQLCDFVDIDGPLLIRTDRLGGLVYDRGMVSLPENRFWGTP